MVIDFDQFYLKVTKLSFLSVSSAGRYYPDVLAHPLLEPTLRDALSNPLEQGGLLGSTTSGH